MDDGKGVDCVVDGAPFRAYRRRWVFLFVIVVTMTSNQATWLSFSPVASYVASYYQVSLSAINLQMTVFMAMHVLVTPLVMWAVDKWSFRGVLVLGALLNGAGIGIKGVSTWEAVTPERSRYTLTLIGSLMAAAAQPMTMMIPTRYSQTWHPPRERTMATAVACMSAPVGAMLGLAATPLFVRSPAEVPRINTVWAVPAIVSAVVAVCGITASAPPTPPSASAAHRPPPLPFFRTLRTLLSSKSVLVLMLCFGPAIGLLNTIAVLFGQVLCPHGYSPQFVGLCGALLFGCGIPGALLLSWIAVRTGKLMHTVHVSFGVCTLFVIAFNVSLLFRNVQAAIAVSVSGIGLVGIGLYPLILELGVETSYPIDQTYSSSVLFLPASVIGPCLVALASALGGPLSDADMRTQTCSGSAAGSIRPVDPTNFAILSMVMSTTVSVGLLAFFRTAMHRTNRDMAAPPDLVN